MIHVSDEVVVLDQNVFIIDLEFFDLSTDQISSQQYQFVEDDIAEEFYNLIADSVASVDGTFTGSKIADRIKSSPLMRSGLLSELADLGISFSELDVMDNDDFIPSAVNLYFCDEDGLYHPCKVANY